ncbi:YveK family protein [Terrisporobacter sp.]
MEQNINLREYLDILKRRRIIVVIIMVIFLLLGVYKTYVNYVSYVPTYKSNITVRINTSKNVGKKKKSENDEDNNQSSPYSTYNVAMNQSIASSYKSLASSPNVTNIIASSLKVSSAEVGSISVSQREDMAEFIDISVINRNKEMAKKVAKMVPEAFNQELIRLVGFDCVEVVYEASDSSLIGRSRDVTLLKSAGIGVVVSIFFVLLAECLDTKIVTPDDVNKYWNYQLIGTVPLDKEFSKGKHSKK